MPSSFLILWTWLADVFYDFEVFRAKPWLRASAKAITSCGGPLTLAKALVSKPPLAPYLALKEATSLLLSAPAERLA